MPSADPQTLADLELLEQAGQLPKELAPDLADLRVLRDAGQLGDAGTTSTTTTPTMTAQRQSEQQFGRGVAETVGGVLGGTAGAMSGGGTPMSAINAVAGAGLGQGIGGQAFDALAQLFGTQQPKSLTETATDVGGDVLSGAKGEMGGQIVGSLIGKGIDKTLGTIAERRARRLAMEARKAAFKQQGIQPMASDLTQSRAVGQIENAPTAFITGSGRIQRAREGQVSQAIGAAERTLNPTGQAPEPIAAGVAMQEGVNKAASKFKAQTGALFDQVEREAGDEALVPTGALREAIDSVIERKARSATGVSRATRNVQDALGPGREAVAPRADALKGLGLNEDAAALMEFARRAERIPFWMARELEAQLGELQRLSAGQKVGNLRQGEYAQLYTGLRKGMDEFLDSEGGSKIAPRLAALKQDWRTGKQLFNDSLGPLLQSGNPEDAFQAVFKPTNVTQILDFRTAVSDDVWRQSVDAWKGSLLNAARDPRTGVLVPTKLAREIEKYEKGGTLDLILGKGAQEVRDLASTLKLMGSAERVAGGANTSGTGQQLINSGILSGALGYATNPAAAAGTFLAPNLLSRYVTSPTGVDQLSRAASPVVPNLAELLGPEGLRPLTQWLGAR